MGGLIMDNLITDKELKAIKQLAMLYYVGDDFSQSYSEALRYFTEAAEMGDAHSQATVGYMYEQGLGTDKNMPEAIKWIEKAAEQGYEKAIKYLEILKQKGEYHAKN